MGINAAPFAFGIVFVVVLPAAVRGLDGGDRILFGEIIAFHDAAYPVIHGGADEYVNQIRIIAQYVVAAPPYDDAWPLFDQGFNDDGLGHVSTVVQGKAVSGNGIRFLWNLIVG